MWVALLVCSACLGQDTAPAAPKGILTLHVTDAYGDPVGPAKIIISDDSGKRLWPPDPSSMTTSDATVNSLPLGDYRVRVNIAGFSTWLGDLKFRESPKRMNIGMELGTYENSKRTCTASGRITGLPEGGGGAWVRLLPVFSNEIFDADVTSNGGFQVEAACGKYVLAVIRGKETIALQPVELAYATKSLTIEVKPQK